MQTFVELWRANRDQAYEGKLLTKKEIIEKHKLATEEEFEWIESSRFEAISIFFTELHSLNSKKLELGSRNEIALRGLEAWDRTLAEIEADRSAILGELELQIRTGRDLAYWKARRKQEAENLLAFEDLLNRFQVFYTEVQSKQQLISDLAASGIGTIETYNALSFFKKMLQKPIHNQFKDNYK
jgi:hypothetical protein